MLPTLWFRNRWSWGRDNPRPSLQAVAGKSAIVRANDSRSGRAPSLLRWPGVPAVHGKRNQREAAVRRENRTPFVKDGINNFIVRGQTDAVNPQKTGTKVAAHYRLTVPPGKCETVRLRLTSVAPGALDQTYGKGNGAFGKHFDEVMQARRKEADEFYATRHSNVARCRTPPTSCARRWPGCFGPSSSSIST